MIRVITTFLMLLVVTKAFTLDTNAVWIESSNVAYTINFVPGHGDSCENLQYYGSTSIGKTKDFYTGIRFSVMLDGSIFASSQQILPITGVNNLTRSIKSQQRKVISDFNYAKGITYKPRDGLFGEVPSDGDYQVSIYKNGVVEKGYLITDSNKDGYVDYDYTDDDIYYPVIKNDGTYSVDMNYSDLEAYSEWLDEYIPVSSGSIRISFSAEHGPLMSVGFDTHAKSIFTGEQYYKKPFTQIMVKSYVIRKDNYRGIVFGSALMSPRLASDMPSDVRIRPEYYDDAVSDGVYKNKNGTYYIKPKYLGSEEQDMVVLFSNQIPRMKAEFPQESWNKKHHFNEICFKGNKPLLLTKAVFKDEYKKVRADFGFPEYNAEPAGLTIRKGM